MTLENCPCCVDANTYWRINDAPKDIRYYDDLLEIYTKALPPDQAPAGTTAVRLNGTEVEGVLHRDLIRNGGKVNRPYLAMWNEQRGDITTAAIGQAVNTGELPGSVTDKWRDDYTKINSEVLGVQTGKSAERGADYIADSMDSRGYGFRADNELITAFVDPRQESLALSWTSGARSGANKSLQTLIGANESTTNIRFIMQTIVGQTPENAARLIKLRSQWLEAGLSNEQANRLMANKAKDWRANRSKNIARSELADAFNQGMVNNIQGAIEEGVLVTDRVVKQFLTAGDDDVCIICDPLDGKIVGFESPFGTEANRYFSYQAPPLHGYCRCSIIFVTYV